MNDFNDWWHETTKGADMNNKKHTNLQFTELTPDDVAIHEDLYIGILPINPLEGFIYKKWRTQLYYYNFKELRKAKQLFQKTFGTN